MSNVQLQSNWTVIPQVRAMETTVYGVKTHYSTAGHGNPIIFVHGGGPGASGASGWAQTIPALAPHFRVYAIDLLGSGYTDKPMIEYSFQTLVEHLAGFIDTLNLGKVRLLGNSQGAYVVAKYALDNPTRVSHLGLISSGTIATACDIPDGEREALPRFDGTEQSVRNFLEVILKDKSKITKELVTARFEVAAAPGHREMLQSIQRYRKVTKENAAQRQLWYLRDRLPQLPMPMCMIWGREDRSAPLEPMGLGLKALLPNVPFHVIEGAGHQVQNDKPDECNRILVDFFTK